MKQQFTQEEANAILMRAVESQPLRETVTWEQLASIAAEVGVSEEALRHAQMTVQAQHGDEETERVQFRRRQHDFFVARIKCVLHLAAFLIVSVVALGVNSEGGNDEIPWSLGIVVPWGMILYYHWRYVRQSMGDEHEEAFQRWRRKRRPIGPDEGDWLDDASGIPSRRAVR